MKQNGKRYDDDFKRMLVDLYNTTNHTYKSLESEYSVTATTIQRWVKDLTPIDPSDENSISPRERKQAPLWSA
ncbi:transposase [Crassaminicella indica]|uniref:transposase n=1 Tax=Crassaminicella indica TaxID=2855394 RepID=UPI003B8392CD